MNEVRLRVETMNPQAFAPFGEVIFLDEESDANFRTSSGTLGRSVSFRSGEPMIATLKTPYQGLAFSKLESHSNVTQTFLPLGGSPAIVAVGLSEPGSDQPPRPDQVRAFHLDGSVGYTLHLGVWHSLDRFPLEPPYTRWVTVTDRETTEDLNQEHPRLTQIVDYQNAFQTSFSVLT